MRLFQHCVTLVLTSFALVGALETSHDGNCGNGVSCMGSMFGGCCRADGRCGSTPDYCGEGCQIKFGFCQDTWGKPSPDGTCGGKEGYVCKGSGFGDCCSKFNFCGGDEEHCGASCHPDFGDCANNSTSKPASSPVVGSIDASSPTTVPTSSQYTSVPAENGALQTPSATKKKLEPRFEKTGPYRSAPSCPSIDKTVFESPCGAQFELQCGIDRSGGDIGMNGKNGFYVETVQDCLVACADYPGCINVAWVRGSPKGACYLKDKIGGPISNSWVQGGVLLRSCTTTSLSPTPTVSGSITSTGSLSTTGLISSTASVGSNDLSSTSGSFSPSGSMSITTITPTTYSTTASTLSTRISQSSSACAAQPTIRADDDCVPCEGQGGSLPFCGADVTTDNYKFTPKTCRTVRYNLDITNTTVAPDGRPRIALLVNGQLPGPTIEANWGDTVEVTVNNKMQNNGTSIHFHGIRQLNNSEYDGVPSVTQCPIAPGESMVYRFVATNYGTSWYHSHFAIQAWEGVLGPMVIHGPVSKQWDVDAGTIMLQDWSQRTVDSMYDEAQDAVNGGPRRMDNGLINGKNTWGAQGTVNQTGERFELDTKFEPGKTYLLRVINSAIQSTYKFYIDNHTLEVINMDFTAIQPYTTDVLNINIGQRYMVLVKANQPAGNYWMRADNQNACAATIQATDIKGIVRYSGTNTSAVPTSTAYNYTAECVDEPLESLIPMSPLSATNSDIRHAFDVTIAGNEALLFKWYLSGTTFLAKLEDPTLLRVLENGTAPTYSGSLILDLPRMKQWVYIVIESAIPLPHPIHLHGHDFFILAAGAGTYTPGSTLLNLQNPPRRDTANMPAAGFLVVAFETDNPGAWLMHCHIGWHTSMGFALQLLEGKDMVRSTVKDTCALQDTCKGWNNWVAQSGYKQHDSGV